MISFANLPRIARAFAAGALVTATMAASASAADMPETILRGTYPEQPAPAYMRWDGISLGAQFGWSNLTADFSDVSTTTALPKVSTNSASFGGFLGYHTQWESLVLGVEGAYTRPASLETSASVGGVSASYKLVDYGTVRGRAGYAFGQFLPYGFIGAAIGRVNYDTPTGTRDNAYTAGFEGGVGVDVAILPNVFVRAEYEYIVFSPVGSVRASVNTARAGVGIRF
jgi:opacity protein-like surface antigen